MASTKDQLQYYAGTIVGDTSQVYSKFLNMDFINAPYDNSGTNDRFFMRTRAAWNIKNPTITNNGSADSFSGGTIKDVVKIGEVYYYMWIKDTRDKIRIYVSTDGCTLKRLQQSVPDDTLIQTFSEFDYCGNIDKLLITDFVKGLPRDVTPAGAQSASAFSYVQVNPDFDGNVTPPTWTTQYVGWPGLLDTGGGTYDTGSNKILPGDYVYVTTAPINSADSCDIIKTNGSGICGQVNIALCIKTVTFGGNSAELLQTQVPWLDFFPGTIDATAAPTIGTSATNNGVYPTTFYVDQPQTTGAGVSFSVFPEYGAVVVFPTAGGLIAINHVNAGAGTSFSTYFCQFDGCYNDYISYTSSSGDNHMIVYDRKKGAAILSRPNFLKGMVADVYPIGDVLGMASFRNYAVYFPEGKVGAFYITRDNAGNQIAQGNIIRHNLGMWKNYDSTYVQNPFRGEAFCEYDNSFFFLGDNKRLYSLSLTTNNGGYVDAQLDDITLTGFGKPLYKELKKLRTAEEDPANVGDRVYMQADGDKFKVFVIDAFTSATTIHVFSKQSQKWTKHYACNIQIKREKYATKIGDFYMFEDCPFSVADEIAPTTFQNINTSIVWNFGDDTTQANGTSMQNHLLDSIKLQLGNRQEIRGVSSTMTFNIRSNRSGWKTLFSVDLTQLDYVEKVSDINQLSSGSTVVNTPPKCIVNELHGCEKMSDPNSASSAWNDEFTDGCGCSKERPQPELCVTYKDRKYYLADFLNAVVKLYNLKGDLFTMSIDTTACIFDFGGFLLGYRTDLPFDNATECELVHCTDCASNSHGVSGSQYNNCAGQSSG